MRQAVMVSPGRIEFRNVPVPVPGSDEVLLEIKRIGICGSDIHVWHGRHPFTTYPLVQGHEFSAVIAKVGDGVKQALAEVDFSLFVLMQRITPPRDSFGQAFPVEEASV